MTRTFLLNCPFKAEIRAVDSQSDLTICYSYDDDNDDDDDDYYYYYSHYSQYCYQKSIEEIANFAKIAKVTRILLAIYEKRLSNNFVKKAMDNSTNCAKLSNKNRQELFKGKKGAKNTCESLFFTNTNGYLNWDTFLSSNFNLYYSDSHYFV